MGNTESCCIAKILKVIDVLQKECNCDCLPEGCDRPFLGATNGFTYNTRPITLYTRSGNPFTVFYYIDNVLKSSYIFRVEDVNGCCAKLRILEEIHIENCDSYIATNEFITVNLECFCMLRCLNDACLEI